MLKNKKFEQLYYSIINFIIFTKTYYLLPNIYPGGLGRN
jgi:hypothetical protein